MIENERKKKDEKCWKKFLNNQRGKRKCKFRRKGNISKESNFRRKKWWKERLKPNAINWKMEKDSTKYEMNVGIKQ